MPHSEFLFDLANLPPAVKYEKLFENLPMLQENIPKTGRRPVSKNSILKALIYKSLRRFPYLADLTFELNNNPSVSKALGFYPLAPAPSIERFSSFLHDIDHLELSSIHKQLVQKLIKAGVISGNSIAIDSCPIVALLKENNLKTSMSYRFDKNKIPASIKQTTGIQNLDTDLYFNERVLLPTLPEQTAIANFLNHKTQQIDDLIAKKERLIELLKEERTAVINQAVTKGLDPNVPMKDSGVEWLGEIPEHWAVKKIKHIAFLKSGDGIKSEQIEDDGEFPVYGGNGLRGYYSEYTHEGDFILIGRQGALCGNIICASGKFWASEHAVVVNLFSPHILSWAKELLISMNLNQYSISAAQPGLSVDRVKNLKIPIPTISEQKRMAELFEKLGTTNEATLEKIEKEIQLLQEYKTSLINEAVTGKIDVRDYQINHV